jgi:type VI secretion system protein ImpM
VAGFYGKLPCKGDFLQRRVAQELVDSWDAWLQQCLFTSREQLQERWLNAYLTSPVWRFALAEGVCGSGAYVGVMVPSVDRVGRYFPLTLVAQLSTEDCLLELASDTATRWFESAESIILGALQAHELDLATFDEQVAALGSPFSESETIESAGLREAMRAGPFARQAGPWQVPLRGVQSLQRAANVFASLELERTLRPLTLWWTDGSDAVAPCWLCNRGLPSPASFAAMIAGPSSDSSYTRVPPPVAPVEASTGVRSLTLLAHHTAVTRRPDSAQRMYFVSRPDVGLWGLSCAGGRDESASALAQAVADALHDISTAGSLTALAEEVRRAIQLLRRPSALHGVAAEAGAVVFLARGNECAVICAGSVQAVRVRSVEVTTIEGASPWMQAASAAAEPPRAVADTSLLDLIAAPPPSSDATEAHYETLQTGDVWVLSGALLSDSRRLGSLPAVLARHSTADEGMLVSIRDFWGEGMDDELPMMLLTATAAF